MKGNTSHIHRLEELIAKTPISKTGDQIQWNS